MARRTTCCVCTAVVAIDADACRRCGTRNPGACGDECDAAAAAAEQRFMAETYPAAKAIAVIIVLAAITELMLCFA